MSLEKKLVNKSIMGETFIWSDGTLSFKPNVGEERIKNSSLKKGYLFIRLKILGKYKHLSVHRLVAKHFIPNDNTLRNQVNHINGDRLDNRVENLEWCTVRENNLHARDVLKNVTYKKILKICKTTKTIVEEIESQNQAFLLYGNFAYTSIGGYHKERDYCLVTEENYLKFGLEECIKVKVNPKKGIMKYTQEEVKEFLRIFNEGMPATQSKNILGIDRSVLYKMRMGIYF